MKTRVSVIRCFDYEGPGLRASLERSLALVGGMERFLKPGSTVFVKINHLSPGSPAERAIVTHPLFTREVLRLLKDLNLEIRVGDDIASNADGGFEVSGYAEMCREMGVRLVNLKSGGFTEVPCPGGAILDRVHVSSIVRDSDFIINLPKLKTHSLTAFTGAVKNMYGVIPSGQRHMNHGLYPRNEDFSRVLVDILAACPPRLTIMDGIVAMEGPGPSGGRPRRTGLVLAGEDAVALDAVAQAVLGFGPDEVLTTKYASERGLGTGDLDSIEILGESLDSALIDKFRKAVLPVSLLSKKLPAALYGYISSRLVLTPEVIAKACTGCRECALICPKSAVRMDEGRAFILRTSCIHCLCCHEVCRHGAIRLRQSATGRIIRFLTRIPGGFGRPGRRSGG